MRLLLILLTAVSGSVFFTSSDRMVHSAGATVVGKLPDETPLTATPRSKFTPTTRKGYWSLDVVDDFTLPKTRSITFCAAGRNLHLGNEWDKLFRRGFSSIDRTRMVWDEEVARDPNNIKPGWKSRLTFDQRTDGVGQHHFRLNPYNIPWAGDGKLAPETYFRPMPGNPNKLQNIYSAIQGLAGSCQTYNDCPNGRDKSGYSKIFFDIENEGVPDNVLQEQANLYTYFVKATRDLADPRTQIGSIGPTPLNGFGYSRAMDYDAKAPFPLWDMKARHTSTSRQRGMPDDIVGKSFSDYVDFQMVGCYYVYPDFDYTIPHTGDADRHWLASVLAEQENNIRLSNKPRLGYVWMFNTQGPFNNSHKASNPAPPAVAEGTAVFYFMTGAYGCIFWDDLVEIHPDQPTPKDPERQGLDSDRVYACYEHFIHGLWRLFKHHGDMFTNDATFLNQNTECSYDGGQNWYKYNSNQIKTRGLPYARAIVKGNQILIAASMPYAKPAQKTSLMVRYVDNGYRFYTTVRLNGDEIYLGRATMEK
ncbi:hypothetical protein [Fibrella aquatilis]|uniref:Uncharacterized protein n=1 Tax=Fibrella aquatilis TaxID=2817059 RepID=A0A939G5G3_9BACT|nr:hypothetical protein [Fibrella aquatilis]MBO0930572.1 hypothetical protein [Fibrella aquatilis]